jgi:hypothetical protein
MAQETEGTQVKSGSFQPLGKVEEFRLIVGKKPNSLIFQVTIAHPELDEPYTIEFFALPDKAMELLQMLEAAAQSENYPIPVAAIRQEKVQ